VSASDSSVPALDPTLYQLLEQLIAFDTTSRNSNLELIAWVKDYLLGFGIESLLVHDKSGSKANLYATVGPEDRSGVMLSGHTDVVPVDGQDWSTDPFAVTAKAGALFGRGTADMKGFIACVLARVPQMLEKPLLAPVHIALSYDEEIGCIGVRRLLDVLGGYPVRPAMGIIGEPTRMKVVNAHKGKQGWRVSIRGRAAHSAYPVEGVNAVEIAAELICHICRVYAQVHEHGPIDEGYRVPHSTVHVGPIEGGRALNIVPDACEFRFEVRHLPDETADHYFQRIVDYAEEALLPRMHAVDPDTSIVFEALAGYPGLNTPADAPVVRFVQMLLEDTGDPGKISFGSEAGLFDDRVKVPCVVCGPGSILQAHRPDEYMEEAQLTRCWRFIGRLVAHLQSEGLQH
jgi:acetylornithine deacetylase|tara:strand:+ start:17439 stop:18644 length:1206 start_codon:yes stop_codon:yes gene_type:complete